MIILNYKSVLFSNTDTEHIQQFISKPMTFQYSNMVITVHYRGLWCSM